MVYTFCTAPVLGLRHKTTAHKCLFQELVYTCDAKYHAVFGESYPVAFFKIKPAIF